MSHYWPPRMNIILQHFLPSDTEKNVIILTWKLESLAELKFDPGFRVIGEYLRQIDSMLSVNFWIDSIGIWVELTRYWESIFELTPYLSLLFESNWLDIESQFLNWLHIWVKLTRYWESNSELTRYIELIWLKYSPMTRNTGSNFSSASDSTF